MANIAGSGSESGSIRHGSEDPDPDPPQNVMDPQHWYKRIGTVVKDNNERQLMYPFEQYQMWLSFTKWQAQIEPERNARYVIFVLSL
jgi:hypothetical protein